MFRHHVLILAVLSLALVSCTGNVPAVKEFALTGEVVRLDAKSRIVTVRHQKIAGWMEAMTMDFPVRENEDLTQLRTGTRIQATVFVQDPVFSIGNLRVLDANP